MIASYKKYAELRDKKGLNDTEVADLIKVSKGSISNWKHGCNNLRVHTISEIALVLGCRVEDLLEEKET